MLSRVAKIQVRQLTGLFREDALFPTLPRWFTDPLHAHLEQRTPILLGRERQGSLPRVSATLPHVHALLEELFYAVFDSRFINPTPSCRFLRYICIPQRSRW